MHEIAKTRQASNSWDIMSNLTIKSNYFLLKKIQIIWWWMPAAIRWKIWPDSKNPGSTFKAGKSWNGR